MAILGFRHRQGLATSALGSMSGLTSSRLRAGSSTSPPKLRGHRRTPQVTVALAVALVMATTGLAAAPGAQAQTKEPGHAVSTSSPVDGPTDAFDAISRAASTNEPVVIDTYTTADTEILANPDGTFTARISAGPVRVPDPTSSSGWTPIDTTLEQTSDGIRPKATIVDLTFSDGTEGFAAKLDLGGRSFAIDWPTPLPKPTLRGDTATYSEVQPGVDLALRATPTGFEHSFILNARPKEDLTFQVPLDLEGLTAGVDAGGALTLAKPDGETFATADAALMWDSTHDDHLDGPIHTAQVKTAIAETSAGPVLELSPASEFLADPSTVYPVVIDPTVDLSVTKDTYVEVLFPNQTYGSDNELKVGAINSGGSTQKARSFLEFAIGPISGTHVTNAVLKLYENHSYSCTGKKVNVYRLTSSWSGPTWNNQPTYGGIYASKTFAYGYSASCPDQWVSISGGGANGNTLTDLVQGWASGSMANHGLAVRADSETDLASWKEFYSSDHGFGHPQLEVTYNSYPNTPTSLSPASGGYQATATPVLNGKFSDPDGGTGRVNFEVRLNSNGNLVVASSTTRTPKANNGSLHPWTVPSGNLTNGTTYKWRARGDDGTDVSAWTSYRTFTVDTTAPTTPTISSSTHPSQTTWYSASLDDVSTSWTTSSDSTSGVAGYAAVWDQDSNTVPSGATQTGTTSSQNNVSPAGIWYLHVRPKDNAGNWGAVTTFVVHLGQAAVTKPTQGDEAVQTFTLAGSAAPSQTTGTFQYRHSPSDETCGGSPGDWCTIPAADLGLGTTAIPLDGSGDTGDVIWNAAATLGAIATPVQIRLIGGLGATSDPVDLAFIPNTSDSDASVGPGSVDLSTGNFALGASDASAFGLGVARTFHSRSPNDPMGAIFGPGWLSGLESYSLYLSLQFDSIAGTAIVTPIAGQPLVYQEKDSGGFETPQAVPGEEEEPAGTLTFTGGVFTLTEHDGTTTKFEQPGGSSAYVPTLFSTPGAEDTMQVIYQVSGGVARPTKMIDALPTGITDCSTTVVPGCRVLAFNYATTTTASGTSEAGWGDFANQVKTISFTAYDPSTASMPSVAVAQYLYDATGRLRAVWDPRISPALKTKYGYDASGHITSLTPPGLNPWTFSYGSISGDTNTGRLLAVSRPGVPSGTATTSVVYRVPVSGAGAPYSMGSTVVDDWGQSSAPMTGTALFPPGHDPVGSPPSSYDWASVHYLDAEGRTTNVAVSNGSGGAFIVSSEYNEFGAVMRSLSPANRERILTGSVSDPSLLWTRYVYSGDGTDLMEEFSPAHQVQLSDGSIQQAQRHVKYTYDENHPNPAACPCHLVTTTKEGARVVGSMNDVDVRTVSTSYDWDLMAATSSIVDPAGLALETRQLLDQTGRVKETRMPADPDGGDAHSTVYTYYVAGTGSGDALCDDHPEWAHLLCKIEPASQPVSGSNLPVTRLEYNLWGSIAIKTETVTAPPATRTTTLAYDSAGRFQSMSISGPGTPVPDVTTTFDVATGLLATTSNSGNSITSGYDALGRIATYQDADGNTSSFVYDLQDRPTSISDGKGTYTFAYDQGTERRGFLGSLTDSQVGTFNAAYDPDGALRTQSYPNGMTATTIADEVGMPISLTYTKTSNCSEDCDWFVDEITPSVHGQWLNHSNSLSEQAFAYDQAGRLMRVDDTPSMPGQGLSQCTRRAYGFDSDSNRTSVTTWSPDAISGACNSTGTGSAVISTYDEADRPTKSGYVSDPFGRITTVPSSDNNGVALSSTYYANDRVRSLTAGSQTETVSIDPVNRIRQLVSGSNTATWHYSGDSDSPSWISENAAGSAWSRFVVGPNDLVVATVDQSSAVTLQMTNLHGDVIGTASANPSAIGPASLGDHLEFGSPRTATASRLGWLGGHSRMTSSGTGALLMGARVYLPSVGRFLQVDPISGGSLNSYDYAGQNPVTNRDLTGRLFDRYCCGWSGNIYGRERVYRLWVRLTQLAHSDGTLSWTIGALGYAFGHYSYFSQGIRAALGALAGAISGIFILAASWRSAVSARNGVLKIAHVVSRYVFDRSCGFWMRYSVYVGYSVWWVVPYVRSTVYVQSRELMGPCR
jgi:RHS repeat-associated protein